MSKVSKAEQARAIQGALTCSHCKCTFAGTASQAIHHISEGRNTYCSKACQYAFLREKYSTPIPNRGACGGCGNEFYSRRDAKFCSMKCYTGSTQFSDMLADARANSKTPYSIAKRAASQLRGEGKPCLECGADVYVKKSEMTKKFCSAICYRSHMAKRFDRQIASPEQMSLPQGYDAFLDREELNCLIEGCGWSGKHLSVHMNAAHGIQANDFKRAAGFNKSTGVVSKDTAQALTERASQGIALDPSYWCLSGADIKASTETIANRINYRSKESLEHRVKGMALAATVIGPERVCAGCGCAFTQATSVGRTKYCTVACRSIAYSLASKKLRADARLPASVKT